MKNTTTVPVQKNDHLTVTIEDLTYEGLGVAKVEGYPIFIENTLPGEEAEILVVKTGKQFAFGKLMKLLSKSTDRVESVNEQLIRTGIAPLNHMTYESQLAFKEKQVRNVMTRIAKMPDVEISPIIGMENPLGYRNKAQIPVRRIQGELVTGFFRKNSHDVVAIDDYYIQDPEIDKGIGIVRDILEKHNVKAYNEKDNTGNIRHIIIRRGHYSKEMMVVLVTRTGKLFGFEQMVKEITDALPEVTSVVQNINPEQTNVILGFETKTLFGNPYITDTLLGKTYHISAQSFYQVNTIQAEKLYQTAIDFADLKATDTVIDAYSGIGTIALSLADKVKHVYGMEIIKSAVQDAKLNALTNGIENVTFEVGKAEDVMKKWQEKSISANVMIVDPPRKGLASSFIDSVLEMAPEKVVYVSCNPATLARDCKLLAEGGYQVKKIQPVDMFAQTQHVESVVLLQRR